MTPHITPQIPVTRPHPPIYPVIILSFHFPSLPTTFTFLSWPPHHSQIPVTRFPSLSFTFNFLSWPPHHPQNPFHDWAKLSKTGEISASWFFGFMDVNMGREATSKNDISRIHIQPPKLCKEPKHKTVIAPRPRLSSPKYVKILSYHFQSM